MMYVSFVEIRGIYVREGRSDLYLERFFQIIVYNNLDRILTGCFLKQQIDFLVEIH